MFFFLSSPLSLNSYIESNYTNCGPNHICPDCGRDIAEFLKQCTELSIAQQLRPTSVIRVNCFDSMSPLHLAIVIGRARKLSSTVDFTS